jgi:hypothetical protein
MSFPEAITRLLNDPDSVKIVTAIGPDGIPHSAPKGTLRIDEEENIEYVEILESSKSYRNATYSLWFDKKVAVLVIGPKREVYEITGVVRTILVAGRKFEEVYKRLEASRGFDISAVVTIVPESVENLSPAEKIAEQEKHHFFYRHLDRIAKTI